MSEPTSRRTASLGRHVGAWIVFIIAGVLAFNGIEGWGWFLFVGVLLL